MHLTELERFLSGEKAERRAAALIKRLQRKRQAYSTRLSAPLSPEIYKSSLALMNAIDAAMVMINTLVNKRTQS